MMRTTRRQFLTGTASLAVAGTSLPKPGWADPLGLPIGIQLYTVGADLQKDAPATIKQIAQIGYKEVEAAGYDEVKQHAVPNVQGLVRLGRGDRCRGEGLLSGAQFLDNDAALALGEFQVPVVEGLQFRLAPGSAHDALLPVPGADQQVTQLVGDDVAQ